MGGDVRVLLVEGEGDGGGGGLVSVYVDPITGQFADGGDFVVNRASEGKNLRKKKLEAGNDIGVEARRVHCRCCCCCWGFFFFFKFRSHIVCVMDPGR